MKHLLCMLRFVCPVGCTKSQCPSNWVYRQMILFDYKKTYFTNIYQFPESNHTQCFFFFYFDEVIYKYIINNQDKRLSQISNRPPPLGNLVRLNALVVYVLLRVSAPSVLRFTSHIPSQFLGDRGEGEDGRILGRKSCEFDCKMLVVFFCCFCCWFLLLLLLLLLFLFLFLFLFLLWWFQVLA